MRTGLKTSGKAVGPFGKCSRVVEPQIFQRNGCGKRRTRSVHQHVTSLGHVFTCGSVVPRITSVDGFVESVGISSYISQHVPFCLRTSLQLALELPLIKYDKRIELRNVKHQPCLRLEFTSLRLRSSNSVPLSLPKLKALTGTTSRCRTLSLGRLKKVPIDTAS